jgi:phage terminase large subunit
MDEVAQMSPALWSTVIRPALADRKGRAIFIGTPFGMHNQFYNLYERAEELEGWNRRTLTVDDTDVLDPDELEAARAEMAEEEFQQEFFCSWSAAIKGAFYSRQMAEAEEEGRITSVPYDESHAVMTSWDLGSKDATVVWFWQEIGSQIRAIRCIAFQREKLKDLIAKVDSYGYMFSQHIAPFDINVQEIGEGSRLLQARRLGVKFKVAPGPSETSRQSGINAVRTMLSRTVFDRANCKDGIEALKAYRTEYNDKRQVFSTTPLHDWTSDYADSVRYFAVTKHQPVKGALQQQLDYRKQDAGVF